MTINTSSPSTTYYLHVTVN